MQYLSKEEMLAKFAQVKHIRPCGHYALVQMVPIEETSKGGIVVHTDKSLERESRGRDLGVVLAFGQTCYEGFSQCKAPSDWGVKVGDVVELAGRYENKIPRLAQYNEDPFFKDLRLVNDNEIIAVGVE